MDAAAYNVVLALSFDINGLQTSAVLHKFTKQQQQTPPTTALQSAAIVVRERPPRCRCCLRDAAAAAEQCVVDNEVATSTTTTASDEEMRHLFEYTKAPGEVDERHCNADLTYAAMIAKCADIAEIAADDGHPQHICRVCEARLNIAMHFRQQCERADERLRGRGRTPEAAASKEHAIDQHSALAEDTKYLPIMDVDTTADLNDGTANGDGDNDGGEEHTTGSAIGEPLPPHCRICYDYAAKRERRAQGKRGGPVHACEQCAQSFVRLTSLQRHVERAHNAANERPYVCDICGARYKNLSSVQSHILARHTAVRQHACPQCDYRAHTADLLRKHLVRHSARRAYACRHCAARFKSNSNWHKHERQKHGVDGGAEAHRCEQCARSFTSADTLRKHRVRHTGEQPYGCAECGRAFAWYTTLRAHMQQQHRGVRVPVERSFVRGGGGVGGGGVAAATTAADVFETTAADVFETTTTTTAVDGKS